MQPVSKPCPRSLILTAEESLCVQAHHEDLDRQIYQASTSYPHYQLGVPMIVGEAEPIYEDHYFQDVSWDPSFDEFTYPFIDGQGYSEWPPDFS